MTGTSGVADRTLVFVGLRSVSLCALVALSCAEGEKRSLPRSADMAASVPTRGRVLGGEAVDRTVMWPAEDALDRDVRGALSSTLRALVDEAVAPVMMPPAEHDLGEGAMTLGSSWWAYTASSAGVTLSIAASTRARVYRHVRAPRSRDRVRDHEAWVTSNEGIAAVSWIEHGAAYTLELECADRDDPACGDRSVRALASSLAVVGGRGIR